MWLAFAYARMVWKGCKKAERYDDTRNLCNRILDLTGSGNNTYSKYAKEMLEVISKIQAEETTTNLSNEKK